MEKSKSIKKRLLGDPPKDSGDEASDSDDVSKGSESDSSDTVFSGVDVSGLAKPRSRPRCF